MKCRIQIYKSIGNFIALVSAREPSNLSFAELPAYPRYLLHQNKLHYIDQHLIGYQSVSGFKNIRNIFPATPLCVTRNEIERSKMPKCGKK